MRAAFSSAFLDELVHLRRDRWDRALVLVMPPALLALIACLFLQGALHELPVAVVDQDNSSFSRELIRAVDATAEVRIAARLADLESAWPLLRAGRVWAVLYVPSKADVAIRKGGRSALPVYYNASFLTLGSTAAGAIDTAAKTVIAKHVAAAARSRGLPEVHLSLPKVQVQLLFNPAASFEWFLESLIDPGVLHLLLTCAAIAAAGRVMSDPAGAGLGSLVGTLAPYVLAYTFWGFVWVVWLSGVRGWSVVGSFTLLMLGQFLLYTTTAAIGALLVAVTRDVNVAYSAGAVYAGSAIAFSNGTLPIHGAPLFTQVWSHVLPFSAYLRLQLEQMFVGSPWSTSLVWAAELALMTLLALAACGLLLRRVRSR